MRHLPTRRGLGSALSPRRRRRRRLFRLAPARRPMAPRRTCPIAFSSNSNPRAQAGPGCNRARRRPAPCSAFPRWMPSARRWAPSAPCPQSRRPRTAPRRPTWASTTGCSSSWHRARTCEAAVAAYGADPNVEVAEPDYIFQPLVTPTDPYLPRALGTQQHDAVPGVQPGHQCAHRPVRRNRRLRRQRRNRLERSQRVRRVQRDHRDHGHRRGPDPSRPDRRQWVRLRRRRLESRGRFGDAWPRHRLCRRRRRQGEQRPGRVRIGAGLLDHADESREQRRPLLDSSPSPIRSSGRRTTAPTSSA